MITNHATHFIVHSYGRTGSIVLTRNLCRAIGSVENPIPNRHLADPSEFGNMINSCLPYDVIHTHAIVDGPKNNYTRVFNIRLDPAEVIMSFICAEHYNTYHKRPTDPQPFICNYSKQQLINICQEFINWHTFYSKLLSSDDCVVTYEQLLSNIQHDHDGRVFSNKRDLILNFDEVNDTIKSQKIDNSLQPFINHQNPWDIYQYIKYSIRF